VEPRTSTPEEQFLAQNAEGHRLVRLLNVGENGLTELPALTHARVIARHEQKVRLVFDRRKQTWQLPGGGLEAGESARACAARELHEESGNECVPARLHFSAAFELLLQPTRFTPNVHLQYGALFEAAVPHIAPFIPNEEIAATLWWDGGPLSHTLDAIDHKLIELSQHQLIELSAAP
jgi:8-oxo-dGTP diphosphatase